jgi:hypothetical protein
MTGAPIRSGGRFVRTRLGSQGRGRSQRGGRREWRPLTCGGERGRGGRRGRGGGRGFKGRRGRRRIHPLISPDALRVCSSDLGNHFSSPFYLLLYFYIYYFFHALRVYFFHATVFFNEFEVCFSLLPDPCPVAAGGWTARPLRPRGAACPSSPADDFFYIYITILQKYIICPRNFSKIYISRRDPRRQRHNVVAHGGRNRQEWILSVGQT